MFLSDSDIEDLTHRKRHDAQMTALNRMGIVFRQRADGSIAVLESHINKVFGGNIDKSMPKIPEPNWGEVNA